MSTDITQPNRNQPVIHRGDDGEYYMTLRVAQFYDALVQMAEDLPDQGTAVADLAGGATLAQTIAKVNELLAVLRTANLIAT